MVLWWCYTPFHLHVGRSRAGAGSPRRSSRDPRDRRRPPPVDREIDRRITSHDIRVRDLQQDTLLPDHQHQRLDQYHRGVRIVGGDLTRQLAPDGTVSVFVMLHTGIDLDVGPKLSLDEARDAMAAA